jgi:hypothetical protein
MHEPAQCSFEHHDGLQPPIDHGHIALAARQSAGRGGRDPVVYPRRWSSSMSCRPLDPATMIR